MAKKFIALVSILAIIFTTILPILLVDIVIIYFSDAYMSSWLMLFGFLLVFYVLALSIGFFVSTLADVIASLFGSSLHLEVDTLLSFVSTYSTLLVLDMLIPTIDLSLFTKTLIVFMHTLIFYALNKLPEPSE